MLIWGWRGTESAENVRAKVIEILARRGYVACGSASEATASVHVVNDRVDGCVVASTIPAGELIAAELSRAFTVHGRYVEVELHETHATATARDVGVDGMLGFAEDLDREANAMREQSLENGKLREGAIDGFVATFLDLESGMPGGGVVLPFVKRRGRVESLVDAVERGATWDKMEVAGRDAIRLKSPSGLRISVLEDDELSRFEAAVRKR